MAVISIRLPLKHRARDMERARSFAAVDDDERAAKFTAFVRAAGDRGLRLADLAAATGWTNEVLATASPRKFEQNGSVVDVGGVYLARESFDRLSGAVVAELERHHKREPLARGMLRETLREKVFAHSLPELFAGVIARLEAEGKVVSEKDIVRLSQHSVGLSEQDAELSNRIEQIYLAAGVEAPSLDEAMTRANVAAAQRAQARKILQLLLDDRKLVRVQGEMFMHAQVIQDLKTKLHDLRLATRARSPDRRPCLQRSRRRLHANTPSPYFEYFDREQVTRRAGDKRLILKPR